MEYPGGTPERLISSVDLLAKSGLSRATLNNYIRMGILPRPLVKRPDDDSSSRAKQMGYFPDSVMGTLEDVVRYKREGRRMEEIRMILARRPAALLGGIDDEGPAEEESTAESGGGPSDGGRESGGPVEPELTVEGGGRGGVCPDAPRLASFSVIAARLQNAAKACAALPPDEYFRLMRRLSTATAALFKKYFGVQGKHGAEELVFYFFKERDSSYLIHPLMAAMELRRLLKKISQEQKINLDIVDNLYMNIGIAHGEEFVGQMAETPTAEWLSQGGTVHAARLLARLARFGSAWATKDLLQRLDEQDRRRIRYGICRRGAHRDTLFENRFSRVMDLLPPDHPEYKNMMSIMALPVTEIQSLR
ncbi:MAG: hypothetical protein AB1558_10810 [Thermodesulfobacteriota bacterium]